MANLNLLFTCPHGGKDVLSNPALLRNEDNYPSSCLDCEKFDKNSDLCTIELTERIADKITTFCGREVCTLNSID